MLRSRGISSVCNLQFKISCAKQIKFYQIRHSKELRPNWAQTLFDLLLWWRKLASIFWFLKVILVMLYWVGSHCSNSRVQIFNIGMILEDAMKVKIYWYQTQSLNPIKSQLNPNFYNDDIIISTRYRIMHNTVIGSSFHLRYHL